VRSLQIEFEALGAAGGGRRTGRRGRGRGRADEHVAALARQALGAQLRGFHCVIRFDFEIRELAIRLDERADVGRALVDGVMNLRQIPFYTYPLRTILVYDFALTKDGGLQIKRLEEMWSFADMIERAPFLVGRFYNAVFRPAAARALTALFRLACALFEGRRGGAPDDHGCMARREEGRWRSRVPAR
jgi:hypothetical protein